MTLKEVPPKKKVKVIPIPKPGLKNLAMVMDGLKDGSIDRAVVIYRQNGEEYYLALTDSSYEALGWMVQKTIIALATEDGDIEEE